MASSTNKITVQIIEEELAGDEMKKLVDRTLSSIRCVLPDTYNCASNTIEDIADDSTFSKYEDASFVIISTLVAIFLMVFVIIDLRRRIKQYKRLVNRRTRTSINRHYIPWSGNSVPLTYREVPPPTETKIDNLDRTYYVLPNPVTASRRQHLAATLKYKDTDYEEVF